MLFMQLLGLLLLLGSTVVFAGDFDAKSVNDAIERTKEYENKTGLPGIHSPEAHKAAQRAAGQFYSPEYQKKIHAETERLKSEQFADLTKGFENPDQAKSRNTALLSDERLYVLISSSVPLSTLRTYAAALDKLKDSNVSMVMRGFVGGMKFFRPTLEFVQSVVVRNQSCDLSTERCDVYHAAISIDPLVFRKYGVRRVPAIAYVRGVGLENVSMREGDAENLAGSQDAYIVYGDVSVDRALETIAKETKSVRINSLVKKLRSGFYAD